MKTATALKSGNASKLLAMRISDDKLMVTVTISPELATHPSAIEHIKTELQRFKIEVPLDIDTLNDTIIQVASSGVTVQNLVIGRGVAATPPIDPQIKWSREFFAHGYFVDPETKLIDYHRKAAAPSVEKDELIAVLVPAKPGVEGRDVFGRAIAPIKPKPSEIIAGPKVSFDASTGEFRAASNGRVKLDGRMLTVLDVFQVAGGVGIESGNIDHRGSVIIDGDVQTEFRVAATGDIEVRDVIGAADIECGGNLVAQKGISSAFGKHIVVKGHIHAKYVERAHIFCTGDVIVESEILDSSIHAGGKVICTGRVQGGNITAATGIEIGEAGAHTESLTLLAAGIDFQIVRSQKEANEEAKHLKEELVKLERSARKLSGLGSHLASKQKIELAELQMKLVEGKARYDELTEVRKKLAVAMMAHRDATVRINKQVNNGTMLRISDSHMEIRDILLGPLIASLDPVTTKIVLSSPNKSTEPTAVQKA